ncbi:hypothetical protein AB5J72_01285 [Streptomyces sp. CG1]|uniref:hypothetical protein n=1 Tax=Streptomyces sp. CG1 TaxID=1287523 RepID=UPI0034E1D41A
MVEEGGLLGACEAVRGQVLDLMAAQHESLRKARASRSTSAGPAQVHELSKPTKPAKKAAAKWQ